MKRYVSILIPMLVVGLGISLNERVSIADELRECGTRLSPEEIEVLRSRPTLPVPPIGGPLCVPIAAHIVRQSDGSGGLPLSQYDQAIIDANAAYVNTAITFFTLGDIDYIDSDDYYFNIDTDAEIDALRGTNVVPSAINIYFTPNLENEGGGLCGISSFTVNPVQGIVMNNGCTGLDTNHSTFPHEIGHYFDLYHTHETGFGVELVDGSNCGTAGDLLCDTPADPELCAGNGCGAATVDETCTYIGGEVDPNGDPYAPDTRQYMSYSRKECRDHFSPLQETKVVVVLVGLRPDHLSNCPPIADAGSDVTAECTSPTTTPVTLDGSGSSDPDGDEVLYGSFPPSLDSFSPFLRC